MGAAESIHDGIYLVGGPSVSHFQDAAVFIIDCGEELVMIDSGAGKSAQTLEANMRSIPGGSKRLSTLILTHCHVDHIGSARYFRDATGCTVVAHDLDADAIESGDPRVTAASWYNTKLPRTPVDRRITGAIETLSAGGDEIHCIHTPGHTPGSMSVYLDRAGKRVLFGQDIHGPFSDDFHSDIQAWRQSMEKLLDLDADILCEGHFGIFSGRERVRKYINGYLDQYANEY
ncbi:MAG TPA: MBL fold metallo-hydrolase [Deltaproteobacteria bacterium]|nr:MBL fold metallo-hydrolase [Deltaproteobacteria bacterium]